MSLSSGQVNQLRNDPLTYFQCRVKREKAIVFWSEIASQLQVVIMSEPCARAIQIDEISWVGEYVSDDPGRFQAEIWLINT